MPEVRRRGLGDLVGAAASRVTRGVAQGASQAVELRRVAALVNTRAVARRSPTGGGNQGAPSYEQSGTTEAALPILEEVSGVYLVQFEVLVYFNEEEEGSGLTVPVGSAGVSGADDLIPECIGQRVGFGGTLLSPVAPFIAGSSYPRAYAGVSGDETPTTIAVTLRAVRVS